MKTLSAKEATRIKAQLLANGLTLNARAIKAYGPPYLVKRRAYGNPDALDVRALAIPQELYIGDSAIVCSVNVRLGSPWTLDFDGEGFFVENRSLKTRFAVEFPKHPAYYDVGRGAPHSPSRVVTLYGGGALGIFAYGDCALVTENRACQYCSIEPNRARATDFEQIVAPNVAEEVILECLAHDDGTIRQIMLNGGNLPDLDKSFSYYVRLAEAARRAVDRSARKLPIHLIAFPPNDRRLIHALSGLDVDVAFNTEVFDENLFGRYCPGKQAAGGHTLIRAGLEEAVTALGKGHVYSIFVGGLESVESTTRGLEAVASMGATPVINVFHADPETPLMNHSIPSADQIIAMGAALQDIYDRFDVSAPFYDGCGRNSLDSEAYSRLF